MKNLSLIGLFLALAMAPGCAQQAATPEPLPVVAPPESAPLQVKIEAFCHGMATFAYGGAKGRIDGKTEAEVFAYAKAALEAQNAPLPIMRLALTFVMTGYRSKLSPEQAESWGYGRCMGEVSAAVKRQAI